VDTRDNAPLIAAGGGLVLFISLFLNWSFEENLWKTDFSDIVLAAIGLFAVAIGGSIASGNALNPPGGPAASLSVAGLVALGMVAVFVFEGEERGFGLFLGLVGVVAIIVGAMGLSRTPAAPPTRTAPPPSAPPPGP